MDFLFKEYMQGYLIYVGWMSADFPAYGGYEYGHERTEEVEEAVGKIGECGYSEHGGLCHAAGVPRDEYAGDGGSVFCGAAEQAGFISVSLVGFFVHIGSKDYGYELVAGGEVEEKA